MSRQKLERQKKAYQKFQKEVFRRLFDEYKLDKEADLIQHPHYFLIARSGIEKLKNQANINVQYKVIYASDKAIYLHVVGKMYKKDEHHGKQVVDKIEETFASASAETSTSKYYPEMAEKRGMARVVLKLLGMYELGAKGEEELENGEDSDSVSHQLARKK